MDERSEIDESNRSIFTNFIVFFLELCKLYKDLQVSIHTLYTYDEMRKMQRDNERCERIPIVFEKTKYYYNQLEPNMKCQLFNEWSDELFSWIIVNKLKWITGTTVKSESEMRKEYLAYVNKLKPLELCNLFNNYGDAVQEYLLTLVQNEKLKWISNTMPKNVKEMGEFCKCFITAEKADRETQRAEMDEQARRLRKEAGNQRPEA